MAGNAYFNFQTLSDRINIKDKKTQIYLLLSCREILELIADITKKESLLIKFYTDEAITRTLEKMIITHGIKFEAWHKPLHIHFEQQAVATLFHQPSAALVSDGGRESDEQVSTTYDNPSAQAVRFLGDTAHAAQIAGRTLLTKAWDTVISSSNQGSERFPLLPSSRSHRSGYGPI